MTAPPPAEASALELEDLSVRYYGRDEDALSHIDLAIAPGELVGLAGRNGAGKSTVALAAAGFVPRVIRAQVSGEVRAFGAIVSEDVADGREHRIGIVFASPTNQLSATKATVREELAFGLENLGVARSDMDARVAATMSQLGIDHLAERYPFQLSGGEQQRVAIASIVVMGMRMLVLDEPTAQLDPGSTRSVAELLERLAADGVGVLVAEHDAEVLGRTERCLVLDGGRIVADGSPGRVLSPPILAPLGLPSPTIVELALALGVEPAQAFESEGLVEALRDRRATAGADAEVLAPTAMAPDPTKAVTRVTRAGSGDAASRSDPPRVRWAPVREQPPTPIHVSGLVHRYPSGVEAVRGIDLRIEPGQSVAIVGQNGSGKTTLVKHLDGLLRPTMGQVVVGDRATSDVRVDQLAGTVGFVFQDPDDQLFSRTVERELAFGPRNLDLAPERVTKLVDQALEAVGLADRRGDNPFDLDVSGRKLVALASILAMDPAVIVLDEPTTGQDWPGVARVAAVVEALTAAGRTVVAITHDMAFAARFGRIVVMREGGIVLDGAPAEVFAPAQHALLATTGLLPPVTARLAARLGLGSAPLTVEALLAAVNAA